MIRVPSPSLRHPFNYPVHRPVSNTFTFPIPTTREKIVPEVIERSTPSTVRVDSSDLISRCKDFLADPTPGDVVEEDIPDHLSKESGEASSSTASSDAENETKPAKRKKKKKKKKKKLKTVPPSENEPLPQS